VEGTLAANEPFIAEERLWKGRFILATNMLDPLPTSSDQDDTPTDTQPHLAYSQMLPAYKTQSSSVERGFRFLKDPMFFADNLFLKNPARIMAMIMVMGIALLVYSLAERILRRQLKLLDETLPHQTGKPTQSITMRRVAQIFEGIDFLVIRSHGHIVERKILNLTPLRLKIISFFSPHVLNYYLVPT
jgi:transposase